jgi:PAS domain S-box-containing protein
MEGMSGFETARLVRGRDRTRHTPIIFLTAAESPLFPVVEAYRLGAVDYLVRPLIPEVIRAKVAVFVELFRKTEQVKAQAEQLLQLERRELERRLAEEGLRRFRTIIEHSSDAICLLDASGTALYANQSTARTLGYPPDEFVGRNVLDLIHPEDRGPMAELFAQLLRRPCSSETATFRYRHRDGAWRWVDGTGTNLLEEPNVRAVVCNYRDVTENRRLQTELEERAQRLAEAARHKDEFLAMLAHELRGPLAPLRNGLHVLRLAGDDARTQEEVRAMLERQVCHLARLVDDLLDASRLNRGKVRLQHQALDLAGLVRTTAEDRRREAEQAGLTLSVAVPEAPLLVDGDETRLAQVLTNLLDNAVKFTEAGGRVEVGLTAADGRAVLRVADTGVGLEPALLRTLFEPFRQADQSLDRTKGGLGLGLALIRGLVELHGGEVEAHSNGPGHGSEFVVRLPLQTTR